MRTVWTNERTRGGSPLSWLGRINSSWDACETLSVETDHGSIIKLYWSVSLITPAIKLELKAIGKGKALRFFEKAFSEGRSKTRILSFVGLIFFCSKRFFSRRLILARQLSWSFSFKRNETFILGEYPKGTGHSSFNKGKWDRLRQLLSCLLNHKLRLAVRSIGRIPVRERKREEKWLCHSFTSLFISRRCTKKALEGRSLGSKRRVTAGEVGTPYGPSSKGRSCYFTGSESS